MWHRISDDITVHIVKQPIENRSIYNHLYEITCRVCRPPSSLFSLSSQAIDLLHISHFPRLMGVRCKNKDGGILTSILYVSYEGPTSYWHSDVTIIIATCFNYLKTKVRKN